MVCNKAKYILFILSSKWVWARIKLLYIFLVIQRFWGRITSAHMCKIFCTNYSFQGYNQLNALALEDFVMKFNSQIYRVYIKYCVFFPKILKHFGLWPFSVFPRCQCVYTHQAGRKPALQQNWQSSKKSQNFKEKHNILWTPCSWIKIILKYILWTLVPLLNELVCMYTAFPTVSVVLRRTARWPIGLRQSCQSLTNSQHFKKNAIFNKHPVLSLTWHPGGSD